MARLVALLATSVALAVMPAMAHAATATIGTGVGNTFSASDFAIDQGDSVIFSNTDDRPHNIKSFSLFGGGFLFDSETLGQGVSGPVDGVEYLASGTYPFFCSLHPGMEADLTVGPGGTARSRPSVVAAILPARKRALARKGILRIALRSEEAVPMLSFEILSNNRRIGSGSEDLAAGTTKVVAIPLPRSLRRKISSIRAIRIRVRGSLPYGIFSGATRTFR
jgi:plastocyanin